MSYSNEYGEVVESRTIEKFVLDFSNGDEFELESPWISEILSVHKTIRLSHFILYAACGHKPRMRTTFRLFVTGNSIPVMGHLFVGTVARAGHDTFHIFRGRSVPIHEEEVKSDATI